MAFKFFSFDWFRSEERKELDRLLIEGQVMKNALLSREICKESKVKILRPYRKLLYSNDNITVVFNSAEILSKSGVSIEIYELVKAALTEQEIVDILYKRMIVKDFSGEEKDIIDSNSHILHGNKDFVFFGGSIQLSGVNLPLAPVVLASFIELEERRIGKFETEGIEDKYEALKMFWKWTALNPIESSREDLLAFVKKNDISITKEGMLELYRRVISVGSTNKKLVDFISSEYFKIKKWKKSPKNYWVSKEDDGTYTLWDHEVKPDGIGSVEGNLEKLYLDIPNMTENSYTDAHTRTKDIRIGQVYKEDENKIDLNNNVSCGAGLHCGSRSFGFDGFGDTGVMVLVNPCKVRSVPNHDSNKMRVSEMFIVGVVSLKDYEEHVDSKDMVDFSQEYLNLSVEELEEQLKTKSFSGLSCQNNVPAISIKDIESIKNSLKNKIIKI